MTVIFSCTSEPQGEPREIQEFRAGRAARFARSALAMRLSKICNPKNVPCPHCIDIQVHKFNTLKYQRLNICSLESYVNGTH